jgi:hypothetical protein
MLDTLRKKLLGTESQGLSEDAPAGGRTIVRDVAAGDILTFGIIEQRDLSGKTCIVGIPTLYHFNQQQFQSYPLYSKEHALLCHMILANTSAKMPYLALSRKIPSARKSELFTEEDYARLVRGETPHHLYAREHTAGMADWLYMHYEIKIRDAKGTSISSENEVKAFNYGLYTSVKEHKALEIERFPSGEFDLCATVFCPATDILLLEPKAALRAGIMPKPAAEPTPDVAVKAKPSAQVFDLPIAAKTPEIISASKASEPTHMVVSAAQNTAIQCNLRMASKLIEEALRNDIRVSDVIRKALGLRVAEMDFIAFDLRLNPADYQILADRFEVDLEDKTKIHQFILEELSHFTGEVMD